MIDSGKLDYYEELLAVGKYEEVSERIEEMLAEKNMQWYNLMGYIYGLVKLGFSEDFLLSRAPIELLLISSKVREIEDALLEEQSKRQSTVNGIMNTG